MSHRFSWLIAGSLPLLLAVFAFRVWVAPPVDHAAIIQSWDASSLERGKAIYMDNCTQCHGEKGLNPPNPSAAAFAEDQLKNGHDPYSMWQTLTAGFKLMPSQNWLSPTQRYDVIHFIREAFFKTSNPSQYTPITDAYLDTLPSEAGEKQEGDAGKMDYGPALTYELGSARSALIVPLTGEVSLYYDLHAMTVPTAWSGDFLDLSKTHHAEYKGNERARIAGKKLGLGPFTWAYGRSFADPRKGDEKIGPVAEGLVDYKGHYFHSGRTILSYAVSGRDVLDLPGARSYNGMLALTHNLRVEPGSSELLLSLGQRPSGGKAQLFALKGQALDKSAGPARGHLLAVGRDSLVAAGVAGAPENAQLEAGQEGRLVLRIPPREEPMLLKVFRTVGTNQKQVLHQLGRLVADAKTITDPSALTGGGPRRWSETLTTSGKVSKNGRAYALDSLGIPFENPWNSWMRTTALDFFKDGRAAVTTMSGDVWIVSGIDKSLDELRWQRFATGLYEPLGVKVKGGTVYVQGRDRITSLHDKNGDGEADFYESFFAFDYVSRGYHAFTFGLDTDSEGNFYTAVSGRKTDVPMPGAVLRITPDGEKSEVVATGFRHPNGLTVGPQDRIFVSDNQGGWIPASKLSYVQQGDFYGYPGWEESEKPRDSFHRPVFWLPQAVDNSSGGGVWATGERWGPLSGRMLHLSYGTGLAFYTSLQEVGGALQGAAVPFPWQFPSGLMRGRVNPKDGQVYLVGQKGWGTRGQEDGTFNRIRYTGQTGHFVLDVKVAPRGLQLTFSEPLKASLARDTSRYDIRRWNYKWSSSYGSPHYVPSDSAFSQEGEERVHIEGIELKDNRRTVLLDLSNHTPVDQMQVDFNLMAEDGTPFHQTIYTTIKKVPEEGTKWDERASR